MPELQHEASDHRTTRTALRASVAPHLHPSTQSGDVGRDCIFVLNLLFRDCNPLFGVADDTHCWVESVLLFVVQF